MDTKKVVIVLLIIAIVFSVMTIVANLGDEKGFVQKSNYNYIMNREGDGSAGVSLEVLPSFVLGVLYG